MEQDSLSVALGKLSHGRRGGLRKKVIDCHTDTSKLEIANPAHLDDVEVCDVTRRHGRRGQAYSKNCRQKCDY